MKLFINTEKIKGHIAPEIYGHFSEHLGKCIYEGLYVGEASDIPNVNGMRTDVVEALKALNIPLLRWPGGCFAEEYHWMDGIGPKDKRKKMVNIHWGKVMEDNSFGTHEYFELCRQLGCKTYVNLNVGSGTVREMMEWVEYMTFPGISPMADLRRANGQEDPWKVDYFGIGNENWGNGGHMTPEYYGNLFRHYGNYVRSHDGSPVQRVCGGPNVDDYEWTEGVLKTCFRHTEPQDHGHMEYLSLHYYVHPGGWENKGPALGFTKEEWYKSLNKALYMETLIERHGDILNQYDPEKIIGLCVDEWGDWFDVEPGTNPGFLYQQNSIRDALVAGVTLNVFNNHCDRVRIACLAQLANVLQSVILTEGEKMIKTPTYHVMHMYRHHQDGDLLENSLTGTDVVGTEEWKVPKVTQSVSKKDGVITITLNNLSLSEEQQVEIELLGEGTYEVAEANIVAGEMDAHNTFSEPDQVKEEMFDGYTMTNQGITVTLPTCSVTQLCLKQK